MVGVPGYKLADDSLTHTHTNTLAYSITVENMHACTKTEKVAPEYTFYMHAHMHTFSRHAVSITAFHLTD